MEPKRFKGDEIEEKFYDAAKTAFDNTSLALDQFLAGSFNASPFLLMLYDEGRVPFSQRIKREAFVDFIIETFQRFPFIGSFESYLFILRAIFGAESDIFFTVTTPGILQVEVNASSSLEFDFIYREADGTTGDIVDYDDAILTFRGISGIETEYELELLFSEIIPAGITPQISLTFFERYDFIGEDGSGEFNVLDNSENQIIFVEVG